MTSLKGSCNLTFLAGRFCVCFVFCGSYSQGSCSVLAKWCRGGTRPTDGSPTSCVASAVWASSLCSRSCQTVPVISSGAWWGLGIHIWTFVYPASLAGGGSACVAFPPALWPPLRVTETASLVSGRDGHALECKVPLAAFSWQAFELPEYCDCLLIIPNIPCIAAKDKGKECRCVFFPCK